ncbi:MAG: hypothetical protein ACMG57_02455 [Candidatus Dojkabacteria bacterium]
MENESFLEEFKKYVANPKSRIVIFLGVAVFSVISIVLVFLVINNNNSSQEIADAKKIEENPAQKADILSQIVKNNPKTSVNSNINPTGNQNSQTATPGTKSKFSGNSGYVTVDPATGLPIGLGSSGNNVAVGPNEQPDLTKYNYRKTTEAITPGQISDVCGYLYSYVSPGRYISSEFFDSNNSYYVRNNEYPDGTLKGFFNSHYGQNINETYSYAGGDYAIKQTYKSYWYDQQSSDILSYPVPNYNPVSGPVSFAVLNNIISNYFGGNATIQRVYQQANKTFYEIQITSKYGCADNTNPAVAPYLDADGNINLVSINTVDAQSFEISNSKTYVDHVAPETLIYSRDYKVEYKLTDFSVVSSEFQNVASSDVRTVDWSNYVFDRVEYANRIGNYLKETNQDLILPVNDTEIAYLSSKNTPAALPNADYYKDRKFYTPGTNGDATFADLMKRFGPNVPNLNYSLTTLNDYSTYLFEQYDTNADYNYLLKNFRSYGPFGTTEFARTVNIGGEVVNVLIRQYIYYDSYYNYYPTSYPASFVLDLANKYPTISALSYPASYPYFGYSNVNYSVLFQYHGKTYTGSVNGWAMDRFLSEPFENVSPATDAGYTRLSQILEGGIYGDGYGYGYSYGFPY